MLSTLSTNIKVLIGISSFIIIGLIYYFIKNIFKSEQIYEKPKSTKSNNSLKENNIQELKDISKNIKDLHESHKVHVNRMKEHMKNVEDHHNFINDTHHNVTKNRKRIILDNSNTDYNSTSGDITIKNDAIKSELGFPYSIYSIVFISSTIPKSSINTPFVNLIIKNSNLQQFFANSNILASIPLNNISGSDTNENVSHYTVSHINHHIIRNPVTEQDLTLQLLQSDGSTFHDLSGKIYSITIEMMVDQGIQVSENN